MFFFSSKPKNNEKEMIKNAPEGAVECRFCKGQIPGKTLAKNYYVCPECGKPLPIPPRSRMAVLADKGSFSEFSWGLRSVDFLEFPGYKEKLEKAERVTGEKNAVLCGTAKIDGHPCVIFIMDSRFMMASMGSVVGEKLTRTFEYATAHRLPVIGFAASGGARMQEGILSLMQMAKVSAAVGRHSEGGNLYISVLTNPTTGGVTAFLRYARGHYSRRAVRYGGLCGKTGRGADHQDRAPRQLPERGIRIRARLHRQDRPAGGAARYPRHPSPRASAAQDRRKKIIPVFSFTAFERSRGRLSRKSRRSREKALSPEGAPGRKDRYDTI